MKKPKKIASKLLFYMFSISFFLILGSFVVFYLYGKSYLKETAQKELVLYSQLFNQSANSYLIEYINKVDASLFETKTNFTSTPKEQVISNKIFSGNENSIEKIFLYDEEKGKAYISSVVKVFGGEHIFNIDTLSVEKYEKKYNSVNLFFNVKSGVKLGTFTYQNLVEYYLSKRYENYSILIKLNGVNLFENITDGIYHPAGIEFNLINENNIVQFSTNKFWVNQKINKYLSSEQLEEGFFQEGNLNFVCVQSENRIFESSLIITSNISNLYERFTSIIYKLLVYSILIFLIISIASIIYVRKVSKSLTIVTDVAKSVGEGDFSNKIKIARNDEIGLLISSFNKMVDSLKESHSQLNLTNDELEQKINELIKTKNELTKKEKLALIGETISKISHEIQNKISGVSVWVQNLEMQPNLDPNLIMYVNEIKDSLNSFVEMLLNFKKFYRKPYLEKEEILISALLKDVLNNYCADVEAKKIKIELLLENDQIILADRSLLEEVIINLIVNAIFFTPENGKITISNKYKKLHMKMTISDNGSGISEENIENIFHPFFTTKSSGSGLGLAISKNIIEAHNGKIYVRIKENEGTEFTFTLPI